MSENGRRVLALGASVGLVALAFVVRGRADDGDGPGGGGDGGNRLVCATELGDVCDALADDYDVTVEDAFTTAERLIGIDSGRAPADLWLAPRPWVEAVEVSRDLGGNDPVTGEASGTIARSPVVLVVQESRADALAGSCDGGTIAWQCVGDAADGPWTDAGGQPNWGGVKAGIADPAAGANLVTLGAATADFLDDPGFASNDFDGALDNWLSGLAASAPAADRPDAVGEMITGGAGIIAVLGTVEAEAGPALGSDLVRVVVPEPVVTADLVAVPIVDEGDDSDAAADLAGDGDLLDALAEAGWRVDGRDPAPGIDTGVELPDQGNLPQGDVLWVLLQRWQDLR
jgi:hypothetical protein